MAIFYGVSHVDLAVTNLAASLRVYEGCLGFRVLRREEGFVELDATPIRIRLIETKRPESRGSIRIQSPQVELALEELLAAGCTAQYPAMRTPQQELVGSVRDPDGHVLTAWRDLTEDEYEKAPELPKALVWNADAEALLKSLLKSVPFLFRSLARNKVTREAESLAKMRIVTREEVIRGFILASPRVTRGRNRKPLEDHGIQVDLYQADWDAD